nr:AgmX/PglI C-terminal domain-containing protein [Pseudenhygromyxa sp. WMMC2535]
MARSADDYRQVTRELVGTRTPDIKDCYDVALQTNETVGGQVVVNFTVEKKTGKIMNPAVDQSQTTAPAELGECVVDAIGGLQLDPADARDGVASFTWDFEAGAPAAPADAELEPAEG